MREVTHIATSVAWYYRTSINAQGSANSSQMSIILSKVVHHTVQFLAKMRNKGIILSSSGLSSRIMWELTFWCRIWSQDMDG
jgi:hypothetical protein